MLHIYHAAYMTSLQQCLLVMPLSEAFGTMLNTTSAAASTAQWRAQFKSCVCTHGILSENSLTTNLHTDIHNNTNITRLMANDQHNPSKDGGRTQRCVTKLLRRQRTNELSSPRSCDAELRLDKFRCKHDEAAHKQT